ncbi:phytoene dehydrogenase-like protein [Prauserella sediminis]|uniref:Pyridine nucleotide-disulfide oxidoreductase domain-containing protein 2 n=1 Tax=Prauserella sediminis TaxID=577680 RepID=A0A839Y005_9PSEU|nr:NAD(P)/FAD-dependent oxidoreductase [Prauserella sediminis]MBB3665626.1 phytoene dehydrogenase-like protein [Prauserella sediminis]
MRYSSETADAVVIGAGPNGLVAANLLADAGWDVLVLEATATPGGAVRSAEAIEPGFVTDLFSAFYPMAAASPVIAGLGLESYGLAWRHAPAALAHVLPDDRAALVSRDLDETTASLAAFAPGDGAAWREEVELWHRIREPLLEALLSPFPPVRAASRLARAAGTADGMRLARMVAMPVTAWARERFRGAGAPVLAAGNALHTDLGPAQAGSAVFGWLLSMLAQDVGFPVPDGGSGALTAALTRRLTARGGRIECGRPVTRVFTGRGRAMGVLAGTPVRARRAVLAAVPAPLLYGRMLDEDVLPARLRGDLRRFEWDAATVKVNWTLSGPIPWTAPEAARAGTVHLGGDLDGLARYGLDVELGTVPADPMLVIGQMAVADRSRAPEGSESAWAYTHVPRGLVWDGDRLRRFTDRMETLLERHAPGFRARVRGRLVQGPGELERANPALVEGAVGGGSSAMHQQLVFRPVPGLGRADTPVDRLFLAGASAHPGGAVHGGPGANAARAAVARAGASGGAYAAAVAGVHRLLYG